MSYVSKMQFDGRPATLGATVLVCTAAAKQPAVEVFAGAVVPAVIESIGPDDELSFRLSDGRFLTSDALDGYDVEHRQCLTWTRGFVATTLGTINRMPLHSWTWPPAVT